MYLMNTKKKHKHKCIEFILVLKMYITQEKPAPKQRIKKYIPIIRKKMIKKYNNRITYPN